MIDGDASLTEDDLDRAEAQLGIPLPIDLRSFYLRTNGGRPEKRLFRRNEDGFLVHYFLPLIADDRRLDDVVENFRIWEAVGPSETLSRSIPIAYDEAGNNLLYSLDPRSHGAIFATRADADSDRQVRYLCGSLDQFLAELRVWS